MLIATVTHVLFYIFMIIYEWPAVACNPSQCDNPSVAEASTFSCFQENAYPGNISLGALSFDATPNATTTTTVAPVVHHNGTLCKAYDAHKHQQCEGNEWHQCEMLKDSGVLNAGALALALGAVALFALGDSVWESQIPAVLQTFFPVKSGQNGPAMANLKLWQSLGIAIMFGLATIDSISIVAVVLLVMQVISSICLLYVHKRVANMDGDRVVE